MPTQATLDEIMGFRDELAVIEQTYEKRGKYLCLPIGQERRMKSLVQELFDLIRDGFPEAKSTATSIMQHYRNGLYNDLGCISPDGFQSITADVDALVVRTRRLVKSGQAVNSPPPTSAQPNVVGPRVFVSHSSRDVDAATAFADLIAAALHLRKGEIRCTSAPGYKLIAGSDFDVTIRDEIESAEAFIVLAGPQTVESAYVLFELGARWALRKNIVPIAISVPAVYALPGPLSSIHVANGTEHGDVSDTIVEIAAILSVDVEKASSYDRELAAFWKLASDIERAAVTKAKTSPINTSADPSAKMIEMLRAAAASDGHVTEIHTMDGVSISAGGVEFSRGLGPREEAMAHEAIALLTTMGLLDPVNITDNFKLFRVSAGGHRYLDAH